MTHIQNAVIESASLSAGDHGVLSGWLILDYGGSGQGFGGYCLARDIHTELTTPSPNFCGIFIQRCLEIGGVDKWEALAGRPIRVQLANPYGRILAIGHFIEEKWFDPEEDTKTLRELHKREKVNV